MADVITDRGSSTNGGLKEAIDEIRLNGDKCDGLAEPEEHDSDASSESCISKRIMSEVNVIDKLHELKEKSSISIANGHIKSSESCDVKSKPASRNSESNDSAAAESSAPSVGGQDESLADEQNDDDSAELENDEEEAEDEEDEVEDEEDDDDIAEANDCDSGPLNFAQNNKRSNESEDALDLKANGADSSSQNKDELRRTTEDKTESKPTGAASTQDGPPESNADQQTNNSGNNSGNEHNKSTDDAENESLSPSDGSSEKKKKRKVPAALDITPRRSSRNLNKQKNYSEKELLDFETNAISATNSTSTPKSKTNETDEIEEVPPTDPLADDPKVRIRANKTIVVSDTKGLVEFASSAKMPRSNKKEPTLVIIDTNSILSGRGPVPISQSNNSSSLHSSSSSAPIPVSLPIPAGTLANNRLPASTSAFSVIPIGISSQGMYSQYKNPPPQMKPIVVGPASTTVTPITITSGVGTTSNLSSSVTITGVGPPAQQNAPTPPAKPQPPVILPSLTDDMFVVEAPSFIVPYVYEKPPMKSLKDYIDRIASEVREVEEKKRLENEEKEKLERVEKEKIEREAKEKQEQADREKAEKERVEAEEKKKEEKAAEAADGAGDAASKDESMEVDGESDAKSADKTSEAEATSEKKEESSEKDTALQMDVDEEADPDAAKVTSENDVVLSSSKKVADATPVKKDEPASAVATPATPAVATPKDEKKVDDPSRKQPLSYFDNPLGKFFMQIGLNLVQEHVQTDLLRSQKRRRDKEGDKCSPDVKMAIETLSKTLESSKENNDPFKLELRKCELCSFKTESILVMAHHLETPHMKNYTYRCNFCPFEVRSPHDILFHMESEHNIRGRLERAPAFHQCPNCPFEDNQKGKLTRHMVSCSKKYRPERNQEPPLDWEPPAKIPRVTRNRPPSMSPGNAVYQAAMSGLKQVPQNTLLPKLIPNAGAANLKQPPNLINVNNKRPNAVPPNFIHRFPNAANQPNFQQRPISVQGANQGLMYRNAGANSQTQVILPQNYQLSGAQIYQQNQNVKQQAQMQTGLAAAKLLNQPSISITPLPRQTPGTQASTSSNRGNNMDMKPGKPPAPGSKNSFVVCEICDSGIKDLEQLRNHMQWIHKVKIHPKMIYNRPPLNCQKCQFRFFTDQGLERHLLGSHGLVTSSMQEAANKGKDSGRCPVCGRVYQWKLLNHVARDHSMALKPAHLSYKCTVCTATFGMYKQFESHVYSAHSVVAKRAMDPKKAPVIPPSSSSQNDALLKPLKINDEITIIPQPVRTTKPPNKPQPPNAAGNSGPKGKGHDSVDEFSEVVVIDDDDDDENPKAASEAATNSQTSPKPSDAASQDRRKRADAATDSGPKPAAATPETGADFEICVESCAVSDFASKAEYYEHMKRHVRPLDVRVTQLDLAQYERVPNRADAFRLRRESDAVDGGAGEIISGRFQVLVPNLTSLRPGTEYRIERLEVAESVLEPVTLIYTADARGQMRLIKRQKQAKLDSGFAAAGGYGPCTGQPSPQPYYYSQPAYRRPLTDTEQLAVKFGMSADDMSDLLETFGASHFLARKKLIKSQKSAKADANSDASVKANRGPSAKPSVFRATTMAALLKSALFSQPSNKWPEGWKVPRVGPAPGIAAVDGYSPASPGGATVPHVGPTSVAANHATALVGDPASSQSLPAASPGTDSAPPPWYTPAPSPDQPPAGPPQAAAKTRVPKGGSAINRIPEHLLVPLKMLAAANDAVDEHGNPLVARRVPLAVRQPPYAKVAPPERKKGPGRPPRETAAAGQATKASRGPTAPPTPAGRPRDTTAGHTQPADERAPASGDDVIDLLSDDDAAGENAAELEPTETDGQNDDVVEIVEPVDFVELE